MNDKFIFVRNESRERHSTVLKCFHRVKVTNFFFLSAAKHEVSVANNENTRKSVALTTLRKSLQPRNLIFS